MTSDSPGRRTGFRPSAVPDDYPLYGVGDLALALGGDCTSWTCDFLFLVAKSDPEHREMLRNGVPHLVQAWETWQAMTPIPTAGELLAALAQGWTCLKCGKTSQYPDDRLSGYCGACHDFTGQEAPCRS